MKQLEDLHKVLQDAEAKYNNEYNSLKGDTRNVEQGH